MSTLCQPTSQACQPASLHITFISPIKRNDNSAVPNFNFRATTGMIFRTQICGYGDNISKVLHADNHKKGARKVFRHE